MPKKNVFIMVASLPAGNIAAEDVEFRETLIANGAIRPLTQLMMRADKALNGNVRRGGVVKLAVLDMYRVVGG